MQHAHVPVQLPLDGFDVLLHAGRALAPGRARIVAAPRNRGTAHVQIWKSAAERSTNRVPPPVRLATMQTLPTDRPFSPCAGWRAASAYSPSRSRAETSARSGPHHAPPAAGSPSTCKQLTELTIKCNTSRTRQPLPSHLQRTKDPSGTVTADRNQLQECTTLHAGLHAHEAS
jgi:hypothetical protein